MENDGLASPSQRHAEQRRFSLESMRSEAQSASNAELADSNVLLDSIQDEDAQYEQQFTLAEALALLADEYHAPLPSLGDTDMRLPPEWMIGGSQIHTPGEFMATHHETYALTADLMTSIQGSFGLQNDPPLLSGEKAPDLWTSIGLWSRKDPLRIATIIIPPEPSSIVLGPSQDGDCQGVGFGLDNLCTREEMIEFRLTDYAMMNNTKADTSRILGELTSSDTPFKLSKTHCQAIPKRDHFQLRNLLVSTSQHDAYYSRKWNVFHMDPSNPIGSDERPSVAMDLEHLGTNHHSGCRVTALSQISPSILFAGCFHGQYSYINLDSEFGFEQKPVTGNASARDIINYVDHTPSTLGTSMAIIACNDPDNTLVFLDCHRNETVRTLKYWDKMESLSYERRRDGIVNCTATSPDGRLRVLAGDFPSLLLTNARTGEKIQEMLAHEAGSFACAWADDGWTLATGAEDKTVHIWDARMWRKVKSMDTVMSSCRNLRFSPLGGGALTLFAGEAVDLVHIVDVTTLDRLQTLHFFGDNSGIAISADGSEFMVANGDPSFGGLMVWNRTRENTKADTLFEYGKRDGGKRKRMGYEDYVYRPRTHWSTRGRAPSSP